MSDTNLDERQVINRNKIGNQCFMLLTVLLFADMGLTGTGIRWLPYPANIFVILFVCLFIYLMRLIATNSCAGPRAKKRTAIVVIAVAGGAGAVLAVLLGISGTKTIGDNSGMTLFIISAVLLVVALVVTLIRKKQDKGGDE